MLFAYKLLLVLILTHTAKRRHLRGTYYAYNIFCAVMVNRFLHDDVFFKNAAILLIRIKMFFQM